MKRIMNLFLSLCLAGLVCGCSSEGSNSSVKESSAAAEETAVEETAAEEKEAPEETAASEEDQVDDPAWDAFNDLGEIKTENGIMYVYITIPQSLAGEEVTQEDLDANAGENYTSATLNEDGSVTYKMTKKQHKAMLDEMTENTDKYLQELADSEDYAIEKITHNEDLTTFDVYLSTEELGMAEAFMAMGFYMYGGFYAIFSGKEADNITVNYYSSSGELIETANSSDVGQ